MATELRERVTCDVHLTLTAESEEHAVRGASAVLRCRIRNNTAQTFAGALLRFVLPPEAVVAADDAAATILSALEPHAELTIAHELDIHCEAGEPVDLDFETVLTLADGRTLRSNVAALRLRPRARLNGPGTFVHLQPTHIAGEIIVNARIVNDGNAPARAIRLDLPPPAGTRPIEPANSTAWMIEQLDGGASCTFAYRARIIAPAAYELHATDASLRDGEGMRIALPSSAPLMLSAAFPTPTVCVVRNGRRLHVTLHGINAGSGSARDVVLTLGWPPAFSCAIPSLTWNGARIASTERQHAFARADVGSDGAQISVASIDAGKAYELAFDLDASSVAQAGTLRFDLCARSESVCGEVALPWSACMDIRLRTTSQPAHAIDVGTCANVVVELFNAGDNDALVSVDVQGPAARVRIDDVDIQPGDLIAIAAGDRRQATIAVEIANQLCDGDAVAMSFVAGVPGQELARTDLAIRVRNRVWIDTDAWFGVDAGVAVVKFANAGATAARNAVLMCADGTRIEIGDIPPGTTIRKQISDIEPHRIARGASLTLDGQPTIRLTSAARDAEADARPAFDAILRVTEPASVGEMMSITLHAVCAKATRTLSIRAQALDALRPIPGSLTVDDCPVGDGDSAIYLAEGLLIHDIAARTHIDVRWCVRVATIDAVGRCVRVDIEADGLLRSAFSPPLTCGLAPAKSSVAYQAPGDAVTLFLPLDSERIDAIVQRLHVNSACGTFSHVRNVLALFPTCVRGTDETLASALSATHASLENLCDRLSMKLRIPQFVPTVRDAEDSLTRSALEALLVAAARSTPAARTGAEGAAVLEVELDRQWARRQAETLAQRPLDDGIVLGTILRLVTFRADGYPGVHLALEQYSEALQAALSAQGNIADEMLACELATHRGRLTAALSEITVSSTRL